MCLWMPVWVCVCMCVYVWVGVGVCVGVCVSGVCVSHTHFMCFNVAANKSIYRSPSHFYFNYRHQPAGREYKDLQRLVCSSLLQATNEWAASKFKLEITQPE